MACTDLRQPLLSIQQPLGVSLSQETQLDLFNLTDLQTEYSQQDTNFYPYNIQNTLAETDPTFQMSNTSYNNVSSIYDTNQTTSYGQNNFPLQLDYKKFPTKLFKIQKRTRGKSEQRVRNGELEIILDFQDIVTYGLIKSIQIFVKRTNEVVNTPQYVGPVELQPKFQVLSQTKYLVKVDIDSVYVVDGKKVYHLQKTLTEELNTFHLIINITLQDGRYKSVKTREFLLVGRENIPGEKRPMEGRVRKSSESSVDSSEPLCKAASLSSGYGSPQLDEDVFRARKIVTKHIETKSIEVGDMLLNSILQSPNGDIAYHYTLDDPTLVFKEGQIVGITFDKVANKQNIVMLTSENASGVVLKGVITRSQYLEAMVPRNFAITETICMMGIVPVRVRGSVDANEPLYASVDCPGVAVAGGYLNYKDIKDASLVGYAFQSRHAGNEDEIGMVQAGVSVLSSASQLLLNKRLKDMEHHWERKIAKLKKSNRRFRRCFVSCGLLSGIFAILTGIFLWQLLVPGTAYRYYVCRKGSLAGRISNFKYNPGKYVFNYPTVNGIEFTFRRLMKKTNHNYKPMNGTGIRYYLNIDRCAYGGERSTRDATTGQKRVYGPDVYAVDKECHYVYYYSEAPSKWYRYDSVSWEKHKNIHCVPESKFKLF